MKYYFYFTFILLLIFPLVNAEISPDYMVRVSTDYNVSVPCNSNGFYCNSVNVICNATIKNDLSVPLFTGYPVNITSNFIHIILNSSQISRLGDYYGDVKCRDSTTGLNSSTSFILRVTPTGQEASTSQSIIYIIVFFASGIILLLCFWGAVALPWKNERDQEGNLVSVNDYKYLKVLLWFMSWMFLIWNLFLMYNISFAYLHFNVASDLFQVLYKTMLNFTLPIFVFFVILTVIKFVEDQKLIKDIERGIGEYK